MRLSRTLIGFYLPVALVAGCAKKPDPRIRAFSNQTTSGLKMIDVAEETFWADSQRYTTALESLHMQLDPAVHPTIIAATKEGWVAKVTHDSLPNFSCVEKGGAGQINASAQTDRQHREAKEMVPVCDSL